MFKNNLLQVNGQINQSIQDMLKEANINVDFDENLSDSQKKTADEILITTVPSFD